MHEPGNLDRRTVLKSIGVGVVAGTVLSGTATAYESCTNPDYQISMMGFNFHPRRAYIDLSDGPVWVQWTNDEKETTPHHDHNVNLSHQGPLGEVTLVASRNVIEPGEAYCVKLYDDGDGSLVIEDDDDEASVLWNDGSVTIDTVCSHHAANMTGSLKVTK